MIIFIIFAKVTLNLAKMKIDYKNTEVINTNILPLVEYLQNIDDSDLWNYMGMSVEIDPTVDYRDSNVLIRWTDTVEGFNDKIIINSLKEFKQHFQKI